MLDIYRDGWITARMQDGSLLQTGVRGCFEHADQIQDIFVDGVTTAMDNASVFSLLEVFLCRVTRLLDEVDKYELFLQGKFDSSMMQKLDAYVKSCEEKGISFDVFDEKRPFMQNAQIPAKVSPSAVSVLDAVMLSGHNSIFHAGVLKKKCMENQYVMTEKQYAASVIRNCQFRIAAGAGYSPSGLCTGQPPLYLIPEGRNLFETLVLSLPCYDSRETSEKDLPLWEQEELPVDVPKLITNHALGYCAVMFLPTVGMHYGKVEGDTVSTVYTWTTTTMYQAFGKDCKIHFPSNTENMDVLLDKCTNFLVYDNKKGHKSVCTFSAERDMLLDLFRLNINDLNDRFKYFGYNSLEAVKFIKTVRNDMGGDVPEKIMCRIFGLRMLKQGEPQPAQLSINMELPTKVMTNEDAYAACADLVQRLYEMAQTLESTLIQLDQDMAYNKDKALNSGRSNNNNDGKTKEGNKGKPKAGNVKKSTTGNEKKPDYDHLKDTITQATRQYTRFLHNCCTNGWLQELADANDFQGVKEKCLQSAYQEAIRIYDQYPVLNRDYISKIRRKENFEGRLKRSMEND